MRTFRNLLKEENEEFHQCKGEVVIRGLNFYKTRRCTNKGIIEKDGEWYCGMHNPERRVERQQKKNEKFENDREKNLNLYIAHLQSKARNKKK